MTDSIGLINQSESTKKLSASLSIEGKGADLQDNSHKKLGDDLTKESQKYSNDSRAQSEQAREYLHAADALEKMAKAIRVKADELRKKEIKKEEAVKQIAEVIAGNGLQMPVPKDATPEQLEKIADDLENRAKENRVIANDLLKGAEEKEKIANKLKEQATMINQKENNMDDLRLKSVMAHSQGLNEVFKKLGIFKVEAQYKEQLAYAEKKAQEKGIV